MATPPPDFASIAPVSPAGAPRTVPLDRRLTWLLLGLVLVVPWALLAKLCTVAAGRYYVEIPIQATTMETAQLYFSADTPWAEENSSALGLSPSSEPLPMRFALRGAVVNALRFDPVMSASAITVGTPRLHSMVDAYLGEDTPGLAFPLEDIVPLQQIQALIPKNGRLLIIPTADATDPACLIQLKQPLHLDFSRAAFWRAFLLTATGWGLLVAVVYLGAGRLFARVRPFTTYLLEFRAATVPPVPRPEQWLLWALFLFSALIQVNAIAHDGAMGQDFEYNFGISKDIVLHPEQPLPYAPTNPHGFHVVNAFIYWLTGGVHAEAMCGLFNACVNLGALWVFYLLARRFVSRSGWRMTLMTLVTFLPLRLIHTVVIAADALTLLPMFTLAWVLTRMTDQDLRPGQRRALALAASVLLVLGLAIKYTFMSSVVAVALTLLQLARRRQVRWTETALLAVLALGLPFLVVEIGKRAHPDFSDDIGLNALVPNTMSYGDVLAVKKTDLHIFKAPPWNESLNKATRAVYNGKPQNAGVPYELLTAHRHGYLALIHLMTFTDGDNIFQYDPTDAYFGQRSERNQRLMAWAVKTAVPITLLCIGCMAVLSGAVLLQGFIRPAGSRPDVETTFLLAFGWFANMIVFLPFVSGVDPYLAGLWDPRLNTVALLLFLLLTVYVLDRLLRGRFGTVAAWGAFAYVVYQSALHVAFLWPWGKM